MNEEELIKGNISNYMETAWYPLGTNEGLTTYQIITFVWSLMCLLPNAVLVHITSRQALKKLNFYYALMNWSICNVLLIISVIHWTIVPLHLISYNAWRASYSFFTAFITLTVVFVTAFTYEKFVTAKDFCRYFIYRFWCVVGIVVIVAFVAAFVEYVHMGLMLFSIGVINIICLIILFINIYSAYKKYDESSNEKSILRLVLAGFYILVTFIERCLFIAGYHWAETFDIFRYIIFIDGYVNFFVLVFCDSQTRDIFLQLFSIRQTERVTA